MNKIGLPVLLFAVAAVFIYMRPLNSPWQPIIAGDGLGYYSYLPATFIHNDHQYEFRWFNAAHDSNYVYSAFPNPEDNLLVKYGDRKINKYYPGLSFLWLPFFAVAHLVAILTGDRADGFTQPYQLAIFFASLISILCGVWFAYRLLRALAGDSFIALVTAGSLFFGTYLFIYSVAGNSLSHAYSFTVLTAFLYCSYRFFSDTGKVFRFAAWAVFLLFLAVSIRPLTALIVLAVPALVPRGWKWPHLKWTSAAVVPLLLTVCAVFFCFRIALIQTGSLLPYTYEGESFDFSNPRLVEALIGYRLGLVTYAPLFLIGFAGVFVRSGNRKWIPLIVFLLAVFLYSAWWYWPILVRALIDFYILPAIPLVYLLVNWKGAWRNLLIFLLLVCVIYFQFKSYQVRNGILVEFGTYKEIFWRNFFRVRPANMYLVPPETIKHTDIFTDDFENRDDAPEGRAFSGERAFTLDSTRTIASFVSYDYPGVFSAQGNATGFRKVRVGFQTYFEGPLQDVHVFIFFRDSAGNLVREQPFYLSGEQLQRNDWDYKEFGFEISPSDSLTSDRVRTIAFGAWNVAGKGRVYIDDAKIEFMVTDKSYETIGVPTD